MKKNIIGLIKRLLKKLPVIVGIILFVVVIFSLAFKSIKLSDKIESLEQRVGELQTPETTPIPTVAPTIQNAPKSSVDKMKLLDMILKYKTMRAIENIN